MKHPLLINSEGKIISGVDKEIQELIQLLMDYENTSEEDEVDGS